MNQQKSPIQAKLDQARWLTSSLPIRLIGDPILATPCAPVTSTEIISGQAKKWAQQLIEFLTAYRAHTGTGRGLAANQIGIAKQIALVLLDAGPQIYFNPVIVSAAGAAIYPETCISVAELLLGDVIRPYEVSISFTNLSGETRTIAPNAMHTRILLHEIDHLQGKLCTDKFEPGTARIPSGDPDEILKPELKQIK